jgi:hypothetical protein
MSDMVYTHLKVAESMCYETFDFLFRSKGKVMEYHFRFDHTCYDEKGSDIGQKLDFHVRYSSNEGSRYVKVEWRTLDIEDHFKPSEWEEIADHDSCWHNCWSDEILPYCRKVLLEEYNAVGDESWYFNCDAMTVYDKED